MHKGTTLQINQYLLQFRQSGTPDVSYTAVLTIPAGARIPALARTEEGYKIVVTALSAALSAMLKKINIKLPMTDNQVVDLAESIIFSSTEDHLALEDVILFMHDVLRGKYGPIYDRFDENVFFEKFEKYRQERHTTLVRHREEQSAHYNRMGADDAMPRKSSDMDADTFLDLYKTTMDDGKMDT